MVDFDHLILISNSKESHELLFYIFFNFRVRLPGGQEDVLGAESRENVE